MSTTTSSQAVQQIAQRRMRTLTSIVREEIAKLIADGVLAAGDRVNESELATRLGVSRGPIREACRSLEEAGLLVSLVNHGVFVRELELDDARQLYEVRSALSGLIGQLAAEKITPVKVKELKAFVQAMEAAAKLQTKESYYKINLEFHQELLGIADNQPLAEMYLSTVTQTHLFRRFGLVEHGSLKVSNQEHREIVQALEKGDKAAAQAAMSRHVANGWARLIVFIKT